MIEVYMERESGIMIFTHYLLYIKNDSFIWSHVAKTNGWAKIVDYPAISDLYLIKLFEINDD